MGKESDEPQQPGRRRFFRQFLASAIEGVEDVGRELNEAKRELEKQRRSWYEPPAFDPSHWKPPEKYGPPWPPPYGPPTPGKVRQKLRRLQQYYYPQDDAVSRGELPPD